MHTRTEREARIIERDATPELIRRRQYERSRQPIVFGDVQHSANLVAQHRNQISGGWLSLLEGRAVMGAAA